EAARAYGRAFAATRAAGRSSRTRLADLLIASTAAAHGLPLYTRNESDFLHLDGIVAVVGV
ncbi:MAG: VapC toxin family PIN domain ribonuclease, partial [Acidimicrobiia bacterium]